EHQPGTDREAAAEDDAAAAVSLDLQRFGLSVPDASGVDRGGQWLGGRTQRLQAGEDRREVDARDDGFDTSQKARRPRRDPVQRPEPRGALDGAAELGAW